MSITEDWLLMIGFIKSNLLDMVAFYKNGIKIDLNNDNLFRYQRSDFKVVMLQYVHQLQNLYFALTGEKLTLKSES